MPENYEKVKRLGMQIHMLLLKAGLFTPRHQGETAQRTISRSVVTISDSRHGSWSRKQNDTNGYNAKERCQYVSG